MRHVSLHAGLQTQEELYAIYLLCMIQYLLYSV
jgi:hypothetical protein